MGVLVFVYFMLTVLLVGNIYHTRHCSLIFLNYLAFWFDPLDIIFTLSQSLSTSTGGSVSDSLCVLFSLLCVSFILALYLESCSLKLSVCCLCTQDSLAANFLHFVSNRLCLCFPFWQLFFSGYSIALMWCSWQQNTSLSLVFCCRRQLSCLSQTCFLEGNHYCQILISQWFDLMSCDLITFRWGRLPCLFFELP